MMNSFFIKDEVEGHFKRNLIQYVISLIFIIVGIIIGVYFILTSISISSLLTTSNKTMIDFINGTANYREMFSSRFVDILICFLILFLFNFNYYTSFINYIFIGYQSSLCTIICGALITLYKVAGFINVIFFVVPINIINLAIMVVFNICGIEKCRVQKSLHIRFFQSFKENYYFYKVLICIVLSLVVCVIHSFILPLIVKSFIVVNY